jgi:hypothetical protein
LQDALPPELADWLDGVLTPDRDDGGPTREEQIELSNEDCYLAEMEEEEEEEADIWLPRDANVPAAFGHNAAPSQPLQPRPEFAPAQEEATNASSAAYSTWNWILMLLHLRHRVDTLEARFDRLERAGPAGRGGASGGGNPGSSGGGGGLDPGRYGGGGFGGFGGGQDQDKDAGGGQGVQQGGDYVFMSFTLCCGAVNYTLMLVPALLAWLHDPKKTAALLFVVAVAVLAATWRNPAQAALVLQSPATSTNQSLATAGNRESSPAATVEELSRPTKGAIIVYPPLFAVAQRSHDCSLFSVFVSVFVLSLFSRSRLGRVQTRPSGWQCLGQTGSVRFVQVPVVCAVRIEGQSDSASCPNASSRTPSARRVRPGHQEPVGHAGAVVTRT